MKLLFQQYFRWLFAGFLIALAFSKGLSSVFEVGLLVLSLLFCWRKLNIKELKQNSLALLPGLMLLAYLLGMLYTTNQRAGWRFINIQHSLLVVPLIVYLNRENLRQHFRWLLTVFVLAVALAGLITGVFNTLSSQQLADLSGKLPFLEPFNTGAINTMSFGLYCPFNSKIQFSNLLGLGIIVNLYLLLSGKKKWYLVLSLLLTVSMSVGLGGRGGQLAALFGVYVFASYGLIKKLLPPLTEKLGRTFAATILGLVILLGTIATPIIAYHTVPPIKQRYGQLFWELDQIQSGQYKEYDYYHFTSLRRLLSWKHTWTLIKQHPILGTGTGDYKDELQKIYDADGFGDIPLNNHSQYLHYWAALGIWGLLLFISIIVVWLVKLKASNLFYAFCIAVMGFYLLAMIPDAVLLRQSDNMLFALFYSWLAVMAMHIIPER